MAISQKNVSFVCLAALMLVMATIMLSCDADPKESCYGLEDGCAELKCKEYCVDYGYTKGSYCQNDALCCCLTAAKPKVEFTRRRD
ncbi:hypothetical protein CFC21_020390 [Triticum aestivum]|uniref:Knottin scorpion toxin-like domain-containing protein n=2 Tax=Triticum aestivum TaxID=4565 RepID=A0A3B6B9Q4_WHEAT|nr:hypothetical protein CFC21_020390 [Triticum aestivum]